MQDDPEAVWQEFVRRLSEVFAVLKAEDGSIILYDRSTHRKEFLTFTAAQLHTLLHRASPRNEDDLLWLLGSAVDDLLETVGSAGSPVVITDDGFRSLAPRDHRRAIGTWRAHRNR